MYEMNLETEGYSMGAAASAGYAETDDLDGLEATFIASAGVLMGSIIGLGSVESHFEDDQGNTVYTTDNGLAGTDYFVKGDEGEFVLVPESTIQYVADNWQAENEAMLVGGALVGVAGVLLTNAKALEDIQGYY